MASVGERPPLMAVFCCALLACTEGSRIENTSDEVVHRSVPEADVGANANEGAVPTRLRVLLAAVVEGGTAGAAGETGSAGAAGSSGNPGTAGVLGGTAGTNSTSVSVYCGDGIRDTSAEECDVGQGSASNFCNWGCQLRDTWASHSETSVPAGSRVARHLGRGRHPVAANSNSFAAALIEQTTPSEQQIRVARYSDQGVPLGDTVMSTGTWVADRSDPVVAVLTNGDVLVAYTEFGGDKDGLGIALRRLRAGQTEPDAVAWVSKPSVAAQYDADILALPDRIVVAYTDEYAPKTGPDVVLREFGLDLAAKSAVALGATSAVEGRVSLARLGSSWGAAWRRAAPDGSEYVDVYDAAASAHWTIGPHYASDGDDQPAIAVLDATRRLVLYTRDAAPEAGKIATTGQLYYALLDTSQPGSPLLVSQLPTTSAYANFSNLSAHRPGLLQAGAEAYVTWSSAQRTSDPDFVEGEEVWYQRLVPALSANPPFVLGGEQTIPRWTNERVGDQRAPALVMLGPSSNQPNGTLVSAWEDYGETLGSGSGEPEVVAQLAPLPLLRSGTNPAGDCSTAAPCAAGQGRCTSNDQCQGGLVCGFVSNGVSNGPNFGFGTNIGVCAAAHCVDHQRNGSETGLDCGGPDCGNCLCGDGIVTTAVGEQCDDRGNSAACTAECQASRCGDAFVNPAAGEECDLGTANNNGQSCKSNCKVPGPFSVWAQQTATSANSVSLKLRLVNATADNQSLSGVSLRYWYTAEGASPIQVTCTRYGTGACPAITTSIVAVSPVAIKADSVMTINLGLSGVLAPDASTPDLELTLAKQNNGNFTATNDYSYPTATLGVSNQIGMYRSSTLIWGQAPSGSYVCNNGVVEPGEVCDPGIANTNCRSDCQGFNIVNKTACTNAAACLSATHFRGGSASDNQVLPNIMLVNRSGVPVAMNQITVKYWFSTDKVGQTVTGSCSSAQLIPGSNSTCSAMPVSVTRISPTYTSADAVIGMTFQPTSQLGVTDTTGWLVPLARRTDNGLMNENNDWSISTASAQPGVADAKIAIYVGTDLWWGSEPR